MKSQQNKIELVTRPGTGLDQAGGLAGSGLSGGVEGHDPELVEGALEQTRSSSLVGVGLDGGGVSPDRRSLLLLVDDVALNGGATVVQWTSPFKVDVLPKWRDNWFIYCRNMFHRCIEIVL